jgi:hypothetical protein
MRPNEARGAEDVSLQPAEATVPGVELGKQTDAHCHNLALAQVEAHALHHGDATNRV